MIKEKELVENINNFLSLNNNLYANEIRMGNGIPDIMIGLALNQEIPYLNDFYQIKAYNEIFNKKIDNIGVLLESLKLPKKKTLKILDELSLLNIIELNNEDIKIKKNINFHKQGINISIEVKLKDWRNGLLQAQRYLLFSDYSYLAIKSEYIKNVDLDLTEQLGIGVIAVSNDNLSEIVLPKQSENCNELFKHISLSYLIDKTNTIKRKNDSFFNLQSKY